MNILLVDDQHSVIEALVRALSSVSRSYTVSSVIGATQALEEAMGMEALDVLVTEVAMHEIDGFRLRETLQERFPNLHTIFFTAHDLSPYPDRTQGAIVLPKSSDVEELIAIFDQFEALARGSSNIPNDVAKTSVTKPFALPTAAAAPIMPAAQAVPTPLPVPAADQRPPVAKIPPPRAVSGAAPQRPVAVAQPQTPAAQRSSHGSGGAEVVPIPKAVPKAVPKGAGVHPEAYVTPVIQLAELIEAEQQQSMSAVAGHASPAPAPVGQAHTVGAGSQAAGGDEESVEIDERSKSARLRSLIQRPGFTGRLDQFQLVDIIQMCSLSRRSGRLSISQGMTRGVIYMQDGNFIHAVTESSEGEQAVYEIVGWESGQFSFDDKVQPEKITITGGWEQVLMEAIRRRDEEGLTPSAEPEESMIGRRIGDYQILRQLGSGGQGDVFEARQLSMDRPVAMKILWRSVYGDPAAVQAFIADASAKAQVQHKSILTVYEAGESEGYYYYTREYIEGASLADLSAHGQALDDQAALQLIRVCAEALSYLNHNKIPHEPLTPARIYLDARSQPKIANIATVDGETTVAVQKEMRDLAAIIGDAMKGAASASAGVKGLLARMQMQGAGGFLSWGALIQSVRELEPRVVPSDAFKLSEQDEAAIRAVEEAKRRQKRTIIYTTIAMFALLWVLGGIVWWQFLRPQERIFKTMLRIPAGEFTYQNNEKASTGEFWIDQYEVTIGQYARFLRATENEPMQNYAHPDQPKSKTSFKPAEWDIYYPRARAARTWRGVPLDLNYPVFNVSWYDAYAYAKWLGRRLPTEQEWEKAARGTNGNIFPWGNEPDVEKLNSKADYTMAPHPKYKAEVDGYVWWSPVDAFKSDKSVFDVGGMAGNVAEWTASFGEANGLRSPVIRGGSYSSDTYELTRRYVQLPAEIGDPRVGFRTVSDTPPPQ